MSSVIDSIERRQQRQGIPRFEPGDRVRVHFQVVEGSRRRTQVFEGIVLKRQGSGARETFTVRKQSFGVGVERTFPLHSPKIEKLEIAARGDVRRAKLYYLRGRIGKAARVAERRWGIDEELISTPTTSAEPGAVDAEGVTIDEAEAVDRGEAPETEAEGEAPEGEAEGDEAPAAEAPESEAAESGQEDAEADAGDEAEPAAGSEGAAEPDSETLETNEPESSETETPTAAEEEAAEEDPAAADEGEQSGDSDKDQA